MDKSTRNAIERATQQARRLLDDDFSLQLEGTFDVLRSGVISRKGGAHLLARQPFHRAKIIAAIEHKRAAGTSAVEAITDYVRDAAFTTLNRFVALKMLEARELVQECISKGEQSAGYKEFCGMAPGVALLPDAAGYRLYVESLFDEFSTEIKVLFDRRDAASVLWPKRQTFDALLYILNASDLSGVWGEDETIGWVYQFFNSGEERKKMRDESQAPRNSRELAVRNQFFTPRYVVQFLVDNTLGRLWLEMHGEQPSLLELCEYLVRFGGEPPQPRLRKDPRDLRILDPACGSGHFLLYSFDLLLAIYEEAWAAEAPELGSEATGHSLQEDYPDLAQLRRAAPGLIVEFNLHGVDIDPRCAQIAALALWLRAQRAWKDCGIAAFDRPRIQRTHIVVAEPMPGDAALVEEFAARLNPALLRDLFRKMVGEMRLAGELGALIPVEEGVAAELHRAREQFVRLRETSGFLPGLEPERKQGELDLSGIDDDHVFQEAEVRIIDALRHFAEATANGSRVRRRLFTDDAAHGIALIDLLRTRFDVVLMNPPFGDGSLGAKAEFEKAYPRTSNDVFAAFVERGISLLHPNGLLGAITSRTGFFLSSFVKWREQILLKEAPPIVFADLGQGVMDAAMVEAAAYCLEKGRRVDGLNAAFLRVLEEEDKGAALLATIHATDESRQVGKFEVSPASFARVPGSPFAYWVPPAVLDLFFGENRFECGNRIVRTTNAMGDNFRFVRCAFEAPANGAWRPWAKGRAQKFYADLDFVVSWDFKRKTYRGFLGTEHRMMERPASVDLFDRPGITWPLRARHFSPAALPEGSVFSARSFMLTSDRNDLLMLLGLASSQILDYLYKVLLGRFEYPEFIVTVLQQIPFPANISTEDATRLAQLARDAWSLRRSLDVHCETSRAFKIPVLLEVGGETLVERASHWNFRVASVKVELAAIQSEIDEICFALYGIGEANRRTIEAAFEAKSVPFESGSSAAAIAEGTNVTGDEDYVAVDATFLAADLVSWAVGVAFGHFDLRVALGAKTLPPDPEPFDPLPTWSPGMLVDNVGLPLAKPPESYPGVFPLTGALVADRGHPQDITAAIRSIFDLAYGSAADRWWNEVAALLDSTNHDIGAWLESRFFEYHIKRYSKPPRKAPIIWQFGTSSGSYSVWLYAHRLTRDSFFQLQADIVGPKLSHEERRLTGQIQNAGASPSASERKGIAAQAAIVEELRTMLDEMKRIAPLWNPNLDDGVVLTMAPLWRLVPQHRRWQKELESKWDELVAGKYDWAHVAMHLWPERVVPKCAMDRSLAIAHELEDIFWSEGRDGKWGPRPTPTRPIEELVRERTSNAVKSALRSHLEAPVANANGVQRRGRRASYIASDEGAS